MNDLLDSEGRLLSHMKFQEMYDIKAPFLLYNGLLSAIKERLSKNSGLKLVKIQGPVLPLNIRLLIKGRKGCKDIYNALNRREEHVKIKAQIKWNSLFEQEVLNWKLNTTYLSNV